jgi:hypothetical protein
MPIALGNIANSAAASVYTSVGNTAITFLSLTNYSASNVTANVFVVPSGNTAGNLNVILSQIEIATLDTYQLYAGGEKLLLSNGDSIQANANANNSITTVTSYTTI